MNPPTQRLLWEGSRDHANHTVTQEGKGVSKILVTSGRTCLALYKRFDHATLWQKMFPALLVGMTGWYSNRCRLTWKLQGTPFNRLYFQLAVRALPTKGIESGLLPDELIEPAPLLPTPHAGLGMGGMVQKREVSITGKHPSGAKRQISLMDYAVIGLLPTPTASAGGPEPDGKTGRKLITVVKGLLPTPDASLSTGGKLTSLSKVSDTGMTADGKKRQISLPDAIRRLMLPTPRSSEWKGVGPLGSKSHEDMEEKGYLGATIQELTGQSGRLSPLFVTEMLGLPVDYLILPFLKTSTSEGSPEPSPITDGETNP